MVTVEYVGPAEGHEATEDDMIVIDGIGPIELGESFTVDEERAQELMQHPIFRFVPAESKEHD